MCYIGQNIKFALNRLPATLCSGVSRVNRLRARLEHPARDASPGSSTLDGPARTPEEIDFGLVLSVARQKGHAPFTNDDLITNISNIKFT